MSTEKSDISISVRSRIDAIRARVETVIVGKRDIVNHALCAILTNGHILIEDTPGVGKTTLAKALATALGCDIRRIQFTPDLLPADVTGSSIFNSTSRDFEFRPGPVFTQVLLADEINRATPKTQAALLECMEERQVTVDGITYPVPAPFFVIATQNQIEHAGTFQLPAAQLDRFLMRVHMGYPSAADEIAILTSQQSANPIDTLQPESNATEISTLQTHVRNIHVDPSIHAYIVALVGATRSDVRIDIGGSPRGSLALLHAAQAWAAMAGRNHVIPDDVKALAIPILAHRISLSGDAFAKGMTERDVLTSILSSVAVPKA